MRQLSSRGIILRKKDTLEQDKWITVFTERYGKLRLIAKGAKKITSRRGSKLEAFNLCQFQIYETSSGKKHITQCELEDPYREIKKDLLRLSAASYVAEITDRLIFEHQRSLEIFKLIQSTLEALEAHHDPLLIVSAFVIQLLTHLGHLPNFSKLAYAGLQKNAGSQENTELQKNRHENAGTSDREAQRKKNREIARELQNTPLKELAQKTRTDAEKINGFEISKKALEKQIPLASVHSLQYLERFTFRNE